MSYLDRYLAFIGREVAELPDDLSEAQLRAHLKKIAYQCHRNSSHGKKVWREAVKRYMKYCGFCAVKQASIETTPLFNRGGSRG